jgi:hypothetical protein
VAHIRPEFFGHIEERIQAYLLSPFIRRISQGSIGGWIVKVGDSSGHSISRQF